MQKVNSQCEKRKLQRSRMKSCSYWNPWQNPHGFRGSQYFPINATLLYLQSRLLSGFAQARECTLRWSCVLHHCCKEVHSIIHPYEVHESHGSFFPDVETCPRTAPSAASLQAHPILPLGALWTPQGLLPCPHTLVQWPSITPLHFWHLIEELQLEAESNHGPSSRNGKRWDYDLSFSSPTEVWDTFRETYALAENEGSLPSN